MSRSPWVCWLGLVVCAALTAPAVAAEAAPRPHVVLFLIDDLAYADCGFNGGREIQTPVIDRLAREGAVLESHYVQPVCSPTRAALMTGRYPTRTGVYSVVRPQAPWGLPLAERTLAVALRDAGYTTAIVGKWHLGEFERAYQPTARGFDHQYGHFFGMIDNYTHTRDRLPDWYRDDQPLREEGYSTHLLTREACRLIEAQPKDRPLFLYVPYNAVHAPLQVPEQYLKPYGALEGNRRQLAGMLAAVDEGIGQIVAALDRAGMREQTLIVFSADNGGPPPGKNTPLRGYKGSLYEGGIRAAAFAHWPGRIPAGQRIRAPLHAVDWYPTLVKLAGGSLEQSLPLDGRDAWPLLTGTGPAPHEAILVAQSPTAAAVRIGDWKLIERTGPLPGRGAKRRAKPAAGDAEPAAVELYHLADDLGEQTNLAEREPERVAALRARLAELLAGAVPPGDARAAAPASAAAP